MLSSSTDYATYRIACDAIKKAHLQARGRAHHRDRDPSFAWSEPAYTNPRMPGPSRAATLNAGFGGRVPCIASPRASTGLARGTAAHWLRSSVFSLLPRSWSHLTIVRVHSLGRELTGTPMHPLDHDSDAFRAVAWLRRTRSVSAGQPGSRYSLENDNEPLCG